MISLQIMFTPDLTMIPVVNVKKNELIDAAMRSGGTGEGGIGYGNDYYSLSEKTSMEHDQMYLYDFPGMRIAFNEKTNLVIAGGFGKTKLNGQGSFTRTLESDAG